MVSANRIQFGEIFKMSPIGPRHARCVMFLNEVFVRRLGGRAIVSPQNPVRLHRRSESQPDVILLRPPLDRYAQATPGPGDTLLVVEVADTSQHRDRVIKLPRYAAAGIPGVWIVDFDASALDFYRDPLPDRYRRARRAVRGQSITPEAFPDLTLAVSEVLG